LAHDIIERMRANPAGLYNGDYHLKTAVQHSSCYSSSGCTTSQMAANDMYEWAEGGMHSVSRTLPSGKAIVCKDSTPSGGTVSNYGCDSSGSDSMYAIKIWWVGANGTNNNFVTTVAF
jgi:Tfp pilus assembly protein PilV